MQDSQPDFGSRTDFYTFAPESLADVLPAFEIQREVGKGSMGIVYEAIVRDTGERVALKVLPPSLTLTERALARFIREGEIMSRIRHPGIVGVIDLGHRGRLHYFVMEFVDGMNLDDRLEVGPLPIQQAARIGAQVARALQYAHDHGVVHRDVKPSNLILGEDGSVWITDFGLARETGTGSMTESGAIVGTPMFMAPEQITGALGTTTTTADVYGLGATLYTLVTGRPPFEGPSAQQVLRDVIDTDPERPSKLRRDIPRDLEAIILTAIEKEPSRRYGSAAELGDDLDRFLAGGRVTARIPGPVTRLGRTIRKHQLLSAMIALAIISTITALLLSRDRLRSEIDTQLARASGLVAQAVSRRDDQLRPLDESERRDRLNAAIAAASSVIELDPRVARAWFVRGQAHHHLREFAAAAEHLDEAERILGRPTPEVLHYRIDARKHLLDRESRQQLYADLATLIAIDPSPYNRCIVAFHLLELAHGLGGEARERVLDQARSIIEPVPEPDAQRAVIMARVLELEGERTRALAAIRRATTEFRGNAFVHGEAAAMLRRSGLADESAAQAALARNLDPDVRPNASTEMPIEEPDAVEIESLLEQLESADDR